MRQKARPGESYIERESDTKRIVTIPSQGYIASVLVVLWALAACTAFSYDLSGEVFTGGVEILFSDDADVAESDSEQQDTFAVFTRLYATETVKAPAYTLDSSEQGGLNLDIRSDAHNVVVFIDGSVDLALDTVAGAQTGQDFAVHGGASLLGGSYDDVHAAFGAALAASEVFLMPALDADGYSKLPAVPAFLSLMVEDLSATVVERTVIIRNATEGVASYQTFTIQFPQPVDRK